MASLPEKQVIDLVWPCGEDGLDVSFNCFASSSTSKFIAELRDHPFKVVMCNNSKVSQVIKCLKKELPCVALH